MRGFIRDDALRVTKVVDEGNFFRLAPSNHSEESPGCAAFFDMRTENGTLYRFHGGVKHLRYMALEIERILREHEEKNEGKDLCPDHHEGTHCECYPESEKCHRCLKGYTEQDMAAESKHTVVVTEVSIGDILRDILNRS